jgi:hypothetical protein
MEEVPPFTSDAEEAEFRATHRLADELWDQLPPVDEAELRPARARTRPVPIRFDDSTLQRIYQGITGDGVGAVELAAAAVERRPLPWPFSSTSVTAQSSGAS